MFRCEPMCSSKFLFIPVNTHWLKLSSPNWAQSHSILNIWLFYNFGNIQLLHQLSNIASIGLDNWWDIKAMFQQLILLLYSPQESKL